MKRTIFLIAAAGSVLTAFLFFQPVSGDGGGLMTPATLASPVASTSEQPAAFASPTASNVVTGNASTNTPTLKAKAPISSSTVINSPNIQGGLSIKGGGGDDDDDEGYEGDDDDEDEDDEDEDDEDDEDDEGDDD
jgi:hypothetical protein